MKINLPVTQHEIEYSESDVFVTKTDLKGTITYANESFMKVSGFSYAELIGKNHNLLRHPDMPEWAFADLWKTIKSGHAWRGIVKNRAKNGDHYWVLATVSPIIENDNIVGYMSLRNKPSRAEIAHAEAQYIQAKKTSSNASLSLKFKNLSLKNKLQILIQPSLFILLTVATIVLSNSIKSIMIDSVRLRAEGLANEVIDGANMLMVTGSISDINSRKLLLQKISSTGNIVSLQLIRAKQVADQYGPGLPEEQIGDDVERQVIASKQPSYSLLLQNGVTIFRAVTPYLVSHNFHGTNCLSCHKAEEGSVNGVSNIEIDMSSDFQKIYTLVLWMIVGQMILQFMLYFLIDRVVEQFVVNQMREYEIAKQKAEAADIAKGEFLSNMSHEIRTPMNAVIGLSDLALHNPDPNEQRMYLRQIQDSSKMLLGIINDILDFSKIEAGEMSVDVHTFNLDELIDNLNRMFLISTQDKGIKFSILRDEQIPKLLIGDQLRLSQVLTNLLGNAIKFTEHGQISLEVKQTQSGDFGVLLTFTVTDSGIGMTQEQVKNLFQPFVQADNSITRRFGGSGLGLSISRKLAQLLGGDIEVESTFGTGSAFSLHLRLGVPDEAQKAEYSRTRADDNTPQKYLNAAEALQGKRVLLVEDNRVNQLVAGHMLKKLNMKFEIANNGEEAIQQMEKATYDIILMDIQMPVMGGIEAAQLLRQDARFADMPIIAMSAGVTMDEQDKCVAAGMSGFIGKPINLQQLTTLMIELSVNKSAKK